MTPEQQTAQSQVDAMNREQQRQQADARQRRNEDAIIQRVAEILKDRDERMANLALKVMELETLVETSAATIADLTDRLARMEAGTMQSPASEISTAPKGKNK